MSRCSLVDYPDIPSHPLGSSISLLIRRAWQTSNRRGSSISLLLEQTGLRSVGDGYHARGP
jgi:hypothetical protein